MKITILVLAILSLSFPTFSQRCGTNGYINALLNKHPDLSTFKDSKRLSFHNNRISNSVNYEEIITIPVVFYIIHRGEPVGTGTNVSDAQVLSQLRILNEDYGKMYGTPGYGAGVDTKIRFCLAQQDQKGYSTTGIERRFGAKDYYIPYDGNDNLKDDYLIKSYSNFSSFPSDKYLSIYVCDIRNHDLQGSFYGYATFPFIYDYDSDYDGVVINYNYFGDIGSGITDPNFNKGRTATHEVGHWLGLLHNFEGGCPNGNCNTDGDEVCDTDPVPGPAWNDYLVSASNCSSRKNCSNVTVSAKNYMDYNYDQCLDLFTNGQKNRMRDMLWFYRIDIWNNNIENSTLPVGCTVSTLGSGYGSPGGYVDNTYQFKPNCSSWNNSKILYDFNYTNKTANKYYKESIIAYDGIISGSDLLRFGAGEVIHFLPGFVVKEGASFKAEIHDCKEALKPWNIFRINDDSLLTSSNSPGILDNNEIVTSIDENNNNDVKRVNSIQLSPNPSQGVVKILYTSKLRNFNNSVRVCNSAGSVIYKANMNTNEILIDLSEFSKGIYFITIYSEDDTFVKKLILE